MNSLLFYCTLIALFSFDTILRGILHQSFAQSMLCLFCSMLFRSRSSNELIIVFLLVTLESFMDTHFVGMSLLYTIPLALAGISLQKLMHPHSTLPIYGFLTLAIFCKTASLSYFNGFKFTITYTLYELCANLIMLTLCLKLLFKDRLGNRL